MRMRPPIAVTLSLCLFSASCGGTVAATTDGSVATDAGAADMSGANPQLPPTSGHAAVDAWIALGLYKSWHCEPAVHAARAPSPHGMNRICSNDLSSTHGAGEYPVGAANVKELYDDAGMNVVGIAVEVHAGAGATGDSWYWYEKVPAGSAAPHDSMGIVADGHGDAGPAKAICVGCHGAAGSDAAHFGHDYVYTQVK